LCYYIGWPCCWLWWDGLGAYGCGVEGYVTYDGPGIGGFMNQVLVLVVLSSILMKKDLLRNHSNVGDDPHQLQCMMRKKKNSLISSIFNFFKHTEVQFYDDS